MLNRLPQAAHQFELSPHLAPGLFGERGLGTGTGARSKRCLEVDKPKGTTMNNEHIKGAADKAKGAVKDTVGKVTGDKQMQAEGKFDKAKGAAHQVAGDIKDAARKAQDT
jgi:uncharacterized protein YjbJ (UPF0337 family)